MRIQRTLLTGFCGLLLACFLFSPRVARADNLVVDCTGAPPVGAFTSLQAAINSLPLNSPSEPHTITVTGTCVENVVIADRQRLTIEAPGGQMATIQNAAPAGSPADVLAIFRSRMINLRRLVLTGAGFSGIAAQFDSQINVEDCVIENNGSAGGPDIGGILVRFGSFANVRGTTIRNNATRGMGVSFASSLLVGGFSAQEAVLIQNNAGQGIRGFQADSILLGGNVTIEDNSLAAAVVTGGHFFSNGQVADNIFRNNSGSSAMQFLGGASATFDGQNLIQNNGFVGVLVDGSTVTFNRTNTPSGPRATLIEGHSQLGILIRRASEVHMTGQHVVRNNGAAFPGGGISSTRSSLTLQNGVQVINNVGVGVISNFDNGTSISNITVSGNTGEGLVVTRLSMLSFENASTVTGNGGPSVSCDTTSLVTGDLSNLTNVSCSRIERELGPPRPGQIR